MNETNNVTNEIENDSNENENMSNSNENFPEVSPFFTKRITVKGPIF